MPELVAGANVTLTPNVGAGTLVVASTGGSGSAGKKTPFDSPYNAVGDGTTNDLTALQAFATAAFASTGNDYWDFTGNFAISGTLTLGPTSASTATSRKVNVGGELRVTQLAATFETVIINNMRFYNWTGRIMAIGIGSSIWSSRTCAVGILLRNSMRLKIDGLTADNFWLGGIVTDPGVSSNGSGAELGVVVATDCGSGIPGTSSLEATWSGVVNSGSASSTAQRTTINVTAFPPTTITTYQAIGTQQLHVRIGTRMHYVYSIDRTAGTATIFPWIDSSIGTTGTLQWVMGGGLYTQGDDNNAIGVDMMIASNCGKGIADSALYGMRIKGALLQFNGTDIMIGANPTASHIGTCIEGYYGEGSTEQIICASSISSTRYSYVNSGYAIDLSKCWQIGDPVNGSNLVDGGELASPSALGGVAIVTQGRRLNGHKANIPNGLNSTITPRLQTKAPIPQIEQRNSHTINLTVEGSGEYNRLFGFSGGIIGYVGTGTNGAPTGSFTFTPPAGGTINGGAVDATAVFSGFDGPVLFECDHTDTAQLTWIVRPICGQSRANISSLGYTTGAGGAVTQATSKATGVALNKASGQITMNAAALAAGAKVSFIVTNSVVAATDTVILSVASGGTANAYRAAVTALGAGSFTVTVENITAGSLSEAPVINFAVIKAVAA